jgi:CRISPR-associated protein Csm1
VEKDKVSLYIGSMLHDFGKLLHRYNDGRNHSKSGYDYLKENFKIEDDDILDQVLYHHASHIKGSKLEQNSKAYITYIADNIAAGVDRRKNEEVETGGFVKDVALKSIFNILNGNNQSKSYSQGFISYDESINYPTESEIKFDESFYSKIIDNIKTAFTRGIDFESGASYINSLLKILEVNTSFVPSSTNTKELIDISLFDHVKLTSAIASCIYDYTKEHDINDLHEELYKGAEEFYKKDAFLLYCFDISGIQDFIYTIAKSNSDSGTLKSLRARSFYLEIFAEHIIDEILDELSLCRANLLYSGGGHAYMLLPNTDLVKGFLEKTEESINKFLLQKFKTALFIASGYSPCSANSLKNNPDGSYKAIFNEVSEQISAKKLNRYKAEDILYLNKASKCGERECSICRRSDMLTDDNKCSICNSLEKIATKIMKKDESFFTIFKQEKGEKELVLYNDKAVTVDDEALLRSKMNDDNYVRGYGKNKAYTGKGIHETLWVGDYSKKSSFEELAKSSLGIKRLGVIRADVDNLGQTFVAGFEKQGDNKNVTISRTASLSRALSRYFKLHINSILKNGEFFLDGKREDRERNATIVYTGGDDLFIVGSWDDIIGFSVDLYRSLEKFSQGTLTLSAGIGVYNDSFPVSVMAKQTEGLENNSKSFVNKEGKAKNAVTIFDNENCYNWNVFAEKVIEEKFMFIKNYFQENDERGNTLIYNMLELIRQKDDERLNIARFAYLLSRLEPVGKDEVSKASYKEFSKKMFEWIQDEQDKKQLITAIYLYVYITRGKNEEEN